MKFKIGIDNSGRQIEPQLIYIRNITIMSLCIHIDCIYFYNHFQNDALSSKRLLHFFQ